MAYDTQGYIHFHCIMYDTLCEGDKSRIDSLCDRCGKSHADALKEALTTKQPLLSVAQRHYIDPQTLGRSVKEFYIQWNKQG